MDTEGNRRDELIHEFNKRKQIHLNNDVKEIKEKNIDTHRLINVMVRK